MNYKIDATLTEKTSQKGNKYKCVVLKLSPTYEKIVFLDKAEEELLNIAIQKDSDFTQTFGHLEN